jgi:hypothetical protein
MKSFTERPVGASQSQSKRNGVLIVHVEDVVEQIQTLFIAVHRVSLQRPAA